MSASSISTRPSTSRCSAAITSKTARASTGRSGRSCRPGGMSTGGSLTQGARSGPPLFQERPRSRSYVGSGGSGLGGLGRALDRRDVELELDLVRDEHATGLEGGVEAHAPVRPGDGGAALEADPDVAVGVAGRAGLLELEGHGLGDALD